MLFGKSVVKVALQFLVHIVLLNNFCLNVCREEVGPDAARKFLGHTQWLVNYWLLQNGFSIGIGDTIADASTMEKINDTISKAKNDVKELIKQATKDKNLEPEPGRTMMESFENRVNQVLMNVLVWFLHLRSKPSVFWLTCFDISFFHARFLTRLVMMLEVVLRKVCLRVTI